MGLFRKRDKSIKVDVNIDYEKLAEAIVKAQEISAATMQKQKRYTLGTFALPLMIAFYVMSVFGWILIAASFIAIYKTWNTFVWNDFIGCLASVVTLLIILVTILIVALYSVLLWKAAKEIEEETDRNYVVSMFSGVVSFAALIVALVALVKG